MSDEPRARNGPSFPHVGGSEWEQKYHAAFGDDEVQHDLEHGPTDPADALIALVAQFERTLNPSFCCITWNRRQLTRLSEQLEMLTESVELTRREVAEKLLGLMQRSLNLNADMPRVESHQEALRGDAL